MSGTTYNSRAEDTKKKDFVAFASGDLKDANFKKLVQSIDDDSGVNHYVKCQVGFLDRDDLDYLKKQALLAEDAEYQKKQAETSIYERQRMLAEQSAAAEQQRHAQRAAARAAEIAAERARKQHRPNVIVQVKRKSRDPGLSSPRSPAGEAATPNVSADGGRQAEATTLGSGAGAGTGKGATPGSGGGLGAAADPSPPPPAASAGAVSAGGVGAAAAPSGLLGGLLGDYGDSSDDGD